jgi:4-amino-4-deoxy-L-arabinose transferase-like glycosyltransferase
MACGGLFFFPLGSHALWDSDEGRYAEIAREMLASGDWLIPHLNGVLYFEKPPMTYWFTALGLKLFGHNEFGARFFSAFFGLLTIGLICRIGQYWKNERTGLIAGSLLATSVAFFALTQYLVVDMILTFWLTLILLAGIHLLKEDDTLRIRRYGWLFALATAGAFLTKGLIALILPGAIFGLTVTYQRLWPRVARVPWLSMSVLFLLIAAPWVFAVNMRYPFFAPFFFIHEHFARFFTHVHQRSGPISYFIPVVIVGFLPWVMFFPALIRRWVKDRGAALKSDPVATLLVIWALFIFAFFSVSGSKLPAYMLPLFPALALLLADYFESLFDADVAPRSFLWGIDGLIVFFLGVLFLMKWLPAPGFMLEPPVSVIVEHGGMLGVTLALCILMLVGMWGMRHPATVIGGVLVVQVFFIGSLAVLAPILDPWFSTRQLAQVIVQRAQPQDRVVVYGVSYETYVQTLAFYTRRRLALYGPMGELALGAEHAADIVGWFADGEPATTALMASPIGTWVIVSDESLQYLSASGFKDHFDTIENAGHLHLLSKLQ